MSLYNHFVETGENLLDDYSRVQYLIWDAKGECSDEIDFDQRAALQESVSRIRAMRLFDPMDVSLANHAIRTKYQNHIDRKEFERQEPRRKANSYTVKKSVRKAVFEKHGEICLSCGAVDDITLDHVVPVSKGGKNTLDNLQPLCRRCNTIKHDKIQDFRND